MSCIRCFAVSLAIWAGGIAMADVPSVVLSADADHLILTGTGAIDGATLSVARADQSVPLSIEPSRPGETRLVSPWPLLPGTDYIVTVHSGGVNRDFTVSRPPEAGWVAAGVREVAPGTDVVPQNLLRFHVFFETPMARGQARDHIRLLRADGTPVPDAFLELGVEIWSADQRRLTLLFDPGRIKQGVGPNLVLGAPLVAGQDYVLAVAAGMQDATGEPLDAEFRHAFIVGAPERRAITVTDWQPTVESDELSVDFGREMDAASVARHVALLGPDGIHRLPDGGADPVWNLSGWPNGTPLRLVASQLLEDVAGNTLCAPFDVAAGEATRCEVATHFEIEVTR